MKRCNDKPERDIIDSIKVWLQSKFNPKAKPGICKICGAELPYSFTVWDMGNPDEPRFIRQGTESHDKIMRIIKNDTMISTTGKMVFSNTTCEILVTENVIHESQLADYTRINHTISLYDKARLEIEAKKGRIGSVFDENNGGKNELAGKLSCNRF